MSVWRSMLGVCVLAGCVSGVGVSAWAEEASPAGASEPAIHRLFPESWPISIRGWVDGGYTFNGSSPTSGFNGPYNAVDKDRPKLNQLYVIVEKALQGTSGFDVGARFDALMGSDYSLLRPTDLNATVMARSGGTTKSPGWRCRRCMPKPAIRPSR